jgi:mannose-1-phosphate guanylyltransferase
MRAIVLVGGEGTRLRPLTLTTPKQMLPVVDEPMIVRVLESLARHGVDEAVLSLRYMPDAFIEAFPDELAQGVRLRYAVEPEPLDTAGAVRFAALAAGVEETFLVVNGDVLTDIDLSAQIEFHRRRGAEATIALTPVPDPSAFGVVPTDERGCVTAFIEKPPVGQAPTNLINAGMYVLEPSVLSRIAASGRVSIERETFPALVAEHSLYALASEAYWLDTGTPAKYLEAQLDIVAGRRAFATPPASAETSPRVFVAPGAVVDGELEAASYVGSGARVAAGAAVCGSVVSAGAVVETGAKVIRSALLPSAVVGAGCLIEDSIVGLRSHVGEHSRLVSDSVIGADEELAAGSDLSGARVPTGVAG